MSETTDTIVAIATAPGAGGVGIVRLSGPSSHAIASQICGKMLPMRTAMHARFHDADDSIIDDGIVLAFAEPASYTGEDVVELQAHGSQVVLRQLLARCCALGARLARAGEFSERAFLNGKLDLAQAEAVADLVAAGDLRAARAARRALEGEFSQRVDALATELLSLRVQVEAMIDFADEPIETLGLGATTARLATVAHSLDELLLAAQRGRKLRDGLHAVIVGPPNAGKSSLLNVLAGSTRAIVTDIPGTTRDLLTETIRCDGVELTLVDTAGLRDGGDVIEREGMRRARDELERADLALVVVDARDPGAAHETLLVATEAVPQRLWLHNKVDLLGDEEATALQRRAGQTQASPEQPGASAAADSTLLVSARTGAGIEALHARLNSLSQEPAGQADGTFSARARQVDALQRASADLTAARVALADETLDLAAEALRCSHDALGEVTGRVVPDALLGHIFSTFCIGK